jgi:hypothetical protein
MDSIKRPVIITLDIFEVINGFEEQVETQDSRQE